MRNFTVLLFGLCLFFFSYTSNAQTIEKPDLLFAQQKLAERGEIFFTFNLPGAKILRELSTIISIDKRSGNVVYAYANSAEFEQFLEYDLDFSPVYEYYNTNKALTMATTVAEMANWDRYPTHAVYEEMMQNFVTNYPTLCHLDTVGYSVNGWPILNLIISDNIGVDEDEPEFWWSGTMHGDETAGYVLLLRLADYLLANYGTDPEVTNLIDNMEISFNPLANPDGTFNNSPSGTSVSSSTRYNTNGIDLNRNFPTINGAGYTLQPEIQCMMDYSDTKDYVMAVNIHGGIELINYPWDAYQSWENLNADDDWWQYVCFVYADQVEIDAPSTYFEGPGAMDYGPNNTTGVTHGADWYYAIGSRQDYMNYYRYIQEVTLELSDTKLLGVENLNTYWGYNRQAMLNYTQEALFGLRGIVTDACSSAPLADVKVEIIGHDKDNSHVYSCANVGDYHRPIYAGTYDFTFSLAGYQDQTHTVTIVNGVSTRLDVQMVPDGISTPDFTASSTQIFEGETVDFTDASPGSVSSYSWSFSGAIPTGSVDTNPAGIAYSTAGTYDVTLEIVSQGCTVSVTKPGYIIVASPLPVVTDFVADATTVPQGSIVNFTDLSTNNPDTWTWTFSGGNPATSNLQNPSVQYDVVGIYTVELTAENTFGGNTETKTAYITVTEQDLLMSNGTSTKCGGLFKDNGGDGVYSNNIQLTHTIYPETAGAYVRLTFSELSLEPNGGGCYDYISIYDGESTADQLIGTYCGTDPAVIGTNGIVTANNTAGALTVYFFSDNSVNQSGWVAEISCYTPTTPPVADFTSDNTSSCTGEINFTDLSIDGPQEWLWSFGDGNQSVEQHPSHVYTSSGVYTVSLQVTNAYGTDEVIVTDMITINLPTAPSVVGDERCGVGPVSLSASGSGTLNWYDAVTGGNLVYTGTDYTIADLTQTTSFYVQDDIESPSQFVGETSDSTDGSYHNSGGSYYILFDAYAPFILKSIEISAQDAGDHTIEVHDNTGTMITSATVTAPAGVSRVEVNFNIDPGTDYRLVLTSNISLWRNNVAGILNYPYEIPGLVSITGANTNPTTSYYYYFYNWEVRAAPCASARTEVTAVVNPLPEPVISGPASICNGEDLTLTVSSADSYLWSTGSTTDQIVDNPLIDETYSVTVTTGICSASASHSVTVNNIPVADAGADIVACIGSQVQLNAVGGTDFLWSTTETTSTILVDVTGTSEYIVTVTENNCSDYDTIMVIGSAAGTINLSTTNESTTGAADGQISVSVTGGSSPFIYSWSNGSSGSLITGLSAGTYTVTVSDIVGCEVISEATLIVSTVNPPVASFIADQLLLCTGNSVQFTDNSSNSPDSWSWVFQGGTPGTSTDQNPVVVYSMAGTYDVELTVSNNDGSDVLNITGYVSVSDPGTIDFTVVNESMSGAYDGSIATALTGGAAPFAYSWSNGGNTGTISDLAAGTYSLTVTDNAGCFVTDSATVLLDLLPPVAAFSADVTTICEGGFVQFTDESLNNPHTWQWSFDGGSPSTSYIQNPLVQYSSPGIYNVYLTVISDGGLDGITMTGYITVTAPPQLQFSVTDESSIGAGDGAVSVTTIGGVAPFTFSWSTGSNGPVINGLSAGTYSVTVGDDVGCSTSGNADVQVINDLPVPDFIFSSTSICAGNTVQFTDMSYSNITSWFWQFDGGTPSTSTDQNPVVTYNNGGVYDVSLTVGNVAGVDSITFASLIQVSEIAIDFDVTHESEQGASDGSVTALVTGGISPYIYSWNTGDNTMTIDSLAGGIYSILVIDAAGCMSTVPVTVSTLVGVEEYIADNVIVYPVPASDILYLKSRELISEVCIADISGREIVKLQGAINKIDLKELSEGIYILQIQTRSSRISKQIIVNR